MTDLEAYVEAPGRAELVEEVRRKIDALGITYIYYQFISVTGRVVGKGIPADHWERTAERAFSWSTAPRPICSPIATATTSATAPKPPS